MFLFIRGNTSRKHHLAVLRLKTYALNTVQSLHHPSCPYIVDDGNIVIHFSKIKLTFLEKK